MFADLNGDNEVDETEILQQNHYYPFGMNMEGMWPGGTNKYQYNGKEIDNDFGLDWYHYGARMYDPAIARFTGVDPIADQFPNLSPFNYASNDPIKNIDLYGLQGVGSNDLNTFLIDWKVNGFANAVSNYFNMGSLIMGSEQEQIETLTKVHDTANKGEAIKSGVLDAIEGCAQSVGECADGVEVTALGVTASTGGLSSPVTVPIAGVAEVVGDLAVGVEVGVDYARDGKVDQTATDIGVKIVFGTSGKMIDKGVDALKIVGTKNPKHATQSAEAVKSMGQTVNEVSEDATKNKLKGN